MAEKKHRKVALDGEVISVAMNKTIKVRVTKLVKHPRYGKTVKKAKKFLAHDEKEEARLGDKVRIVECRPLSKLKNWRLGEVLVRAHQDVDQEVEQ